MYPYELTKHVYSLMNVRKTRDKPQAPSSLLLAFLIVSRPSYIMIQPSFSPKIFRLTDLDINSK